MSSGSEFSHCTYPRRKPRRILPRAQLGKEAEVDAENRNERAVALAGRELHGKDEACHGRRDAQHSHTGSP